MAVYERVSIGSLAQGAVPPGYTHTRSTAALYVDSDGLLKSAAINTPRRQWDATNRRWGYVGEGTRTNLLLQSILPGGGSPPTSWTASSGSGTATASLLGSADGASAYSFTSAASRNYFTQTTASLSASTSYCLSVWVESVTGSVALNDVLHCTALPAGASTAWYLNGVATSASANVTTGQLHVLIVVAATPGTGLARIGCGCSANATGTVVLSRPQLEAGPAPSSYIPTTTVAVTRGADLLTRALTGPEGTALSTQGTMVVEFSYLGGDSTVSSGTRIAIAADDGTSGERIRIDNSTGAVGVLVTDGGVSQATPSVAGTAAVGVVQKCAVTWKVNDVQFARNGAHGTRDTTATIPTVSAIGIAANSAGALPGSVLVYGWTISDDHYPTDAGMDALTMPTTTRNQGSLRLGLGLGL